MSRARQTQDKGVRHALLTNSTSIGSIEIDIENIDSNLIQALEYMEKNIWTLIPGNSEEYIYYGGVEAGNPSGNTDNIKNIVYKEGTTIVVTQTIEWDINDLVIKISAS